MGKDKSRGKDKGKVKKKKAQAPTKKAPEAARFGRLYDVSRKAPGVTTPTSPSSAPSAPPPTPPPG